MPKSPARHPIEIKISTVVAVAATLHQSDPAALNAALRDITGGEADYFDGEPAILDVGALSASGAAVDWAALIALFKSYRLNPVAVRNATSDMEPGISAHGLSLDAAVAPRRAEPQVEAPPAPQAQPVAPSVATAAVRPSLIIDTPVRAGQRIYAQGCDLIVTAAVNNGAEVIADGSIHIYAPLRGRALAGANGNAEARIFAASMEAELVSIAGIYRTFENGWPKGLTKGPAQVRLSGDKINIVSMSTAVKS